MISLELSANRIYPKKPYMSKKNIFFNLKKNVVGEDKKLTSREKLQ